MKHLIAFLFVLLSTQLGFSQSDSTAVAKQVNKLITICKKVDFSDPNILKLGVYYKAADLIAYKKENQSEPEKINYSVKEEKVFADSLCKSIAAILGKNKDWKLSEFHVSENEGITHYSQKIIYRNSVYDAYSYTNLTFRKIKNDYLLIGVE